MKSTNKLSPLSLSIRGLLAPAALALAVSWSGASAFAETPSGALTAQLNLYSAQENAKKDLTVATASDTDLARAVFDILQNGPSNPGFSAGDLVVAALEGRKDANTVAARLVNAAIVAGDTTANSTTDIVAIVDEVLAQSAALKITVTGQEAITAAALHADADTATTAGSTIATHVFDDISFVSTAAKQAFIAGTLKTIQASDNLAGFVQQGLASIGTNETSAAILIAVADAKNPAAVNAAIAGGALTISTGDADVETFVASAVANSKLGKVLSDVVAGGGTNVKTDTAATYAANVIGHLPNPAKATIGQLEGIASGALRAAGGTTSAGDQTSDILSAVFAGATAANTITAKNVAAIAAGVGVGLGGVDVGSTTRADQLASALQTNAAVTGAGTKEASLQTAIGEAIIKAIGVNSPDAVMNVAGTTANSEGIGANVSSSETLAGALAKASPSTAAAGEAVAGIANLFSASASNQATIAAAAIKADAKAASNIALDVTSLVTTNQEIFALSLATGSGVSAANTPAVIAGAAAAFGTATETVNTVQVYTVSDFLSKVFTQSPSLIPSAVKIATTVAATVDEEQIANVATAVAAELGGSPKLKLSSAAALATALVKAAEAKPDVPFSNRAEEIAEITASIVAGVVGKSSTTSNTTASIAAEEKLIASIGAAVMKAVGTKLQSNTEGASGVPVDLKDALEIQSIAGAIAQTISVAAQTTNFSSAVISGLISDSGTLEKALAKAAGKTFGTDVFNAFQSVSGAGVGVIVAGPNTIGKNGFSTGTGAYQIGSVVRDETPTKNI